MAEFHVEQVRLIEAMMKWMEDLMVKQKQSHSHDDNCHSYIDDRRGGHHREHASNRSTAFEWLIDSTLQRLLREWVASVD